MNKIRVAYNDNYSGFLLSPEALAWMEDNGYIGPICSSDGTCIVPRHHPLLVRCIEELGEQANGSLPEKSLTHGTSDLCIAQVEGTLYYIFNYDGKETVIGVNDMINSR